MANNIRIFVPSWQSFLVQDGQKTATNCRELHDAAKAAVMPEMQARWAEYWQQVKDVAEQNLAGPMTDTKLLMHYIPTPSWYYDCPEELAQKAVFEGEK
jgi:hypothetical protein